MIAGKQRSLNGPLTRFYIRALKKSWCRVDKVFVSSIALIGHLQTAGNNALPEKSFIRRSSFLLLFLSFPPYSSFLLPDSCSELPHRPGRI